MHGASRRGLGTAIRGAKAARTTQARPIPVPVPVPSPHRRPFPVPVPRGGRWLRSKAVCLGGHRPDLGRTRGTGSAGVQGVGLQGMTKRAGDAGLTAKAAKRGAQGQPMGRGETPPGGKLMGMAEVLSVRADRGQDHGAVQAYIVPSDDPHLCETPPACFRRRAWLSGFTGSAGTAVVTMPGALKQEQVPVEDPVEESVEEPVDDDQPRGFLWTDGRYFLQAESELEGTGFELMRSGMPDVLEPIDWLAKRLQPGSKVGIDPMVFTVETARKYHEVLGAAGCSLVADPRGSGNPVDALWAQDGDRPRPGLPLGPLRVHPAEWAGETVEDKLTAVREEMEAEGAGTLLVSLLDEVAWLFNIRGADIENYTVAVAYAVVTRDRAVLFVSGEKATGAVEAHLAGAGVEVRGYDEGLVLEALAGDCKRGQKVWVDPAQCTFGLFDALLDILEDADAAPAPELGSSESEWRVLRDNDGAEFRYNGSTGEVVPVGKGPSPRPPTQTSKEHVLEAKSPIALLKAVKNSKEVEGMVEAHLMDGEALARFLHSLEERMDPKGSWSPTEYHIAEELEEERRRAGRGQFIEPSFPTIAGEGSNGAIIHYCPEEETSNRLGPNSMLLLDSGGQYTCGTTDVTRTVHFGEPTEHQRECFTRVLKGHIALATAVFPEGTPGFMLDSFARGSLWKDGLDYRHGTGHGVGAALNVHEGPQGISSRYSNTTGLKEGMIVSNEPGYYEDGEFGIRIENLVHVCKADTKNSFGGKDYLCFKDLTMAPIQKKLIVPEMLTGEETRWLNAYHQAVYDQVSPRVDGKVKAWLKAQCLAI